MSSRLVAVTYDAEAPAELATFWGNLLTRQVVREARGALLPGDETQVGLWFVAASAERTGPHRLHLHLTSSSPSDQQQTVTHALALGGRHVDVGRLPEEGHVVLADPEGNEFCVIEPGNAYLAGCGFLAELACDGSQDVGYFWSQALGWPLVWDQDEETAIQSPRGGTKIAWGGPPIAARTGVNRMYLAIAPPADEDLAGEVERLLALGATLVGPQGGDGASDDASPVRLTDLDGN